jgi:hypothetical protein
MTSTNSNAVALQDFKVNVKFKLAALWTSVMFCYIYGDYFNLYPPGQVEDFLKGETLLNNPMKLFAASILMSIPSIMIFFSLALQPTLNKWLNIVFGIIFTGIMVLIAISSKGSWATFYIYLAVVESIITLTIVWHAWNWPKEKSSLTFNQ